MKQCRLLQFQLTLRNLMNWKSNKNKRRSNISSLVQVVISDVNERGQIRCTSRPDWSVRCLRDFTNDTAAINSKGENVSSIPLLIGAREERKRIIQKQRLVFIKETCLVVCKFKSNFYKIIPVQLINIQSNWW